MARTNNPCTLCGAPGIPGLIKGAGKCQAHWNAGAFGTPMPAADWRARYLAGLRTQYRAMFRTMAQGGRWNVHRGSAGLVLLQEGAHMDVPLPVLLRDVQAMTEETMITRAHAALGA